MFQDDVVFRPQKYPIDIHFWCFSCSEISLDFVATLEQYVKAFFHQWHWKMVATWRIILSSKWLIPMMIVSPLRVGLWDPFQMAFSWLISGDWSILTTCVRPGSPSSKHSNSADVCDMSHEKKHPILFHYTGWLMGILVYIYIYGYNPI